MMLIWVHTNIHHINLTYSWSLVGNCFWHIHPSSIIRLCEVGLACNRSRRETQASFLPVILSSSSRGCRPPRCSLARRDMRSLKRGLGLPWGSPTDLTCHENLKKEATRRHPNHMFKPPQLAPWHLFLNNYVRTMLIPLSTNLTTC